MTEGGFEQLLADVVRRVMREELAVHSPTVPANDSTGASGPRQYLTVAASADIAGLHACTIRAWIQDGSLKAYRAGRIYRVLRSDLDARLTKDAADVTQQQIDARIDAILAKRRGGAAKAA